MLPRFRPADDIWCGVISSLFVLVEREVAILNVEAAAAEFRTDMAALLEEIGRRIVGHRPILEGVATALLAGGHVLLEGVPGLGKTLLVRTLADALDLSFSRIQ